MVDEPSSPGAGAIIGGVVLLVAGVVVGAVAFDTWLMPGQAPTFDSPSVADVLIDSRLMVGIVGLCGLILAAYLLLSVFARVHRGQWRSAVGPFQVDESVRSVTRDGARLEAELGQAKGTIDQQAATIADLLEMLDPGSHTPDTEHGGGRS